MNEGKFHQVSRLGRSAFALAIVVTWLVLVWIADKVGVPATTPGNGPDFGGQHAPVWELVSMHKLPPRGDVRERLVLFDPSPLFFPAWAESGGGDGSSAAPSVAARNFPPAFRYPEMAPASRLFMTDEPVSAAATAEGISSARWFDGMARTADLPPEVAKPVRSARVDIYGVGGTERLESFEIGNPGTLADVIWPPVELMLMVSQKGAFASPVMVRGSGIDEVDERIRSIVVSELLPTLLLQPGLYRLEVGP